MFKVYIKGQFHFCFNSTNVTLWQLRLIFSIYFRKLLRSNDTFEPVQDHFLEGVIPSTSRQERSSMLKTELLTTVRKRYYFESNNLVTKLIYEDWKKQKQYFVTFLHYVTKYIDVKNVYLIKVRRENKILPQNKIKNINIENFISSFVIYI